MSELVYCDTKEELQGLKDRAMKCKIISLDKMGFKALHPVATFTKRQRTTLLRLMELQFIEPETETDTLFDVIVNEGILNEKTDVSSYPVYDPHFKEEPVKNNTPEPVRDILPPSISCCENPTEEQLQNYLEELTNIG